MKKLVISVMSVVVMLLSLVAFGGNSAEAAGPSSTHAINPNPDPYEPSITMPTRVMPTQGGAGMGYHLESVPY